MQKPKHEWWHLRRNKCTPGSGMEKILLSVAGGLMSATCETVSNLEDHFWDTEINDTLYKAIILLSFSPKSWTKCTALAHVIKNLLESINSYFWKKPKNLYLLEALKALNPLFPSLQTDTLCIFTFTYIILTSFLTWNKSQGRFLNNCHIVDY